MPKKIILFCLFLFLPLSGIVSAETQGSDIILIRVYIPLSKSEGGNIRVYKNDDQVENSYLQPYTERDENNVFATVRKTLNRYTSEGYSIVSSHEFSLAANKVVTTYVLEKK